MKRISILLLIIGITLAGYPQKFKLTDTDGNLYTNGHTISVNITEEDLNFIDEFVIDICVNNITNTELNVRTLRTNLALPEGMVAYACFGMCPPADVLDISYDIEGDSSETYSLHLIPLSNIGLCKFQIEFMAAEESITLYMNIHVQPLEINDCSNSNVSLSAFPNPASANSEINISYTLTNKSNNNRLVIRNIMGTEVMTIPLKPNENSMLIDISALVPGIYFYAIENRNRIAIAKKLIVK